MLSSEFDLLQHRHADDVKLLVTGGNSSKHKEWVKWVDEQVDWRQKKVVERMESNVEDGVVKKQ